MRKYLFLAAASLLLTCTATLAQDSTPPPVDTSGLAVEKVYEDAKAGITGLAKALKAPAEHVYKVLIKQQIVEAVTYIIIYLVFFLFLNFLWRRFNKNYKNTFDKEHAWYRDALDEHPGLIGLLIPACVLTLVFIIMFSSTISDVVTGVVNPEYGAIRSIFEFIK